MNSHIEIINTWTISRLFQELEQGNLRIPRFQRAYVWERSKVVALLNSIYHEFPIGSFFLWETDGSMQDFCRDITEFGFPKKPDANKFSFILDGQQRITSLYVALKGRKLGNIDYSTICFNLDKKIFKIPTLKGEPNNIPAWKLFDKLESMKLVSDYAKMNNDYPMTILKWSDIFTNYPISIIKTLDMPLDEVVCIFERINQGGKRLSLFDLVHASVWSHDFDLREKIDGFNKSSAVQSWGKIDYEIFTQSLALNISGDCVKLHQLSLTNSDCKKVWDRTKECIRLTIDLLKSRFGVKLLSYIPYQNIIPVIQYYYYLNGGSNMMLNHLQAITDWFWTLAFSTRYSSSTLTKMNTDSRWIKDLVNGQYKSNIFTVNLSLDDLKKIRMSNRSVIKNGVLCLLALKNPLDFDNGSPVILDSSNASRQNSKENHHFFPYSLADQMKISKDDINGLLNFALISRHLNEEISNQFPSQYLDAYSKVNPDIEDHMRTHFITKTALEAARKDDFKVFIDSRGQAILDEINKVCHVNDKSVMTVNSNIDENEQEVLLDGVIEDNVVVDTDAEE